MPSFKYQAAGGVTGGTIEAPDRGAAVRALMLRGVTPTVIESEEPGTRNGTAAHGGSGREAGEALAPAGVFSRASMSRSEVSAMVRELATAVQAGLPLVQGLRTIARQGHSTRQKAMLEAIIGEVEHGRSLADAMGEHQRTFGELTVNLVRAGETSGKLGEVLMQAADLLDKDVKLRRGVLAATLYPMILAGLISVAMIIVVTVIVPRILKPLAGSMVKLPLPTRIVQGVAMFFADYWWAIIPGVAIALYSIAKAYRDPKVRLWFDGMILRMPLLGPVMRDVAVSRFTRTLGTLVSAGIPALTSLRVTKGTLGNKAMEQVIEEVCEQVSSGRTIADPMEKSGLFPPMLVQIVNLGERSGRLDQMLTQAAEAFENKTEMSVKLFTTALPPVLVVCLAGIVGFVVLAILLPLLQLQESLG